MIHFCERFDFGRKDVRHVKSLLSVSEGGMRLLPVARGCGPYEPAFARARDLPLFIKGSSTETYISQASRRRIGMAAMTNVAMPPEKEGWNGRTRRAVRS